MRFGLIDELHERPVRVCATGCSQRRRIRSKQVVNCRPNILTNVIRLIIVQLWLYNMYFVRVCRHDYRHRCICYVLLYEKKIIDLSVNIVLYSKYLQHT